MALCKTMIHVVQPNDSFYRLAQRYQTTVPDIIARNPGVNPYNLQVGTRLNICAGQMNESPNMDEMELNNDMRQAWMQNSMWNTMLMNSLFNTLENTNAVEMRLMQTPEDIAAVFSQFYPQATVNQLTQLLADYTRIGGEVMTAMRDNDEARVSQLQRMWQQSADRLARLLANTNPEYDYDELNRMLMRNMDMMERQMRADMGQQHEEAIRLHDEGENQLMQMADGLTEGLLNQFYER